MTVQKYERSHTQAMANLRALKDQLSYYDITAPFTGVVGDIPVKVGDHVTSSTNLTTLTENHPLECYIAIPAEKASVMHKGMQIALTTTEGRQYGDSPGKFSSHPTVDSNSQTVLVKSLYQNSKSELRADQTVTAQIVWQTREGISIPTKAVTQAAGKYFVFVAQKNPAGKLSARPGPKLKFMRSTATIIRSKAASSLTTISSSQAFSAWATELRSRQNPTPPKNPPRPWRISPAQPPNRKPAHLCLSIFSSAGQFLPQSVHS